MKYLFLLILNFFYKIFALFNHCPIPLSEKNDEKQLESIPAKPVIPYEEKYLEEWSAMDKELNKDRDLKELKNIFLLENSPIGNVCLYYNSELECFEYYSDHNIPYRYLETIGRKYSLQNRCPMIYIDIKEEINKAKIKAKEEEEKNKSKEEKKENKVFANFKNYNSALRKTSSSSSNIQKKGRQDSNLQLPESMKRKFKSMINEESSSLLIENSNKYVYKGKMSNFNFIKKPSKKQEKLSYKEFMLMQRKK